MAPTIKRPAMLTASQTALLPQSAARSAAIALLAVVGLSCWKLWSGSWSREAIRNLLKGQPHKERGSSPSVAWKKDSDPAVATDQSPLWVALDKAKWTLFSQVWRMVLPVMYPTSRCFYDVRQHPGVRGLVALTVDDCFCRQGAAHSLLPEYRQLFARYAAKATFFVTGVYSEGAWCQEDIHGFVRDGHELANHCFEDREYDDDSATSFEDALDKTDKLIEQLQTNRQSPQPNGQNTPGLSWFRAPSANLSKAMEGVLAKRGMTHVLTDGYANDPHIPDARFVAWAMCRRATHGSILVIHMPEKGFREWNVEGTELVLRNLQAKGLRCVTLSELAAAAGTNS